MVEGDCEREVECRLKSSVLLRSNVTPFATDYYCCGFIKLGFRLTLRDYALAYSDKSLSLWPLSKLLRRPPNNAYFDANTFIFFFYIISMSLSQSIVCSISSKACSRRMFYVSPLSSSAFFCLILKRAFWKSKGETPWGGLIGILIIFGSTTCYFVWFYLFEVRIEVSVRKI